MAHLVTRPQKFTTDEWKLANNVKHANAERDRVEAERLIKESDRLDNETRERSDHTLDDVNKKLDQRLSDINYWKSELENRLKNIYNEIDSLEVYKKRIEKNLEFLQEPLHIAQTCLSNREKRYDIDLVHDNVQQELIKEVECENGAIALLQKLLEEAKEQLRLNRKAKFDLESDLTDKFGAKSIDEFVRNLTLTNPDLYLKSGVAAIEPHSFNETQWENHSDNNIKKAESTTLNSEKLRAIIDAHLKQVANDIQKQIEYTNRALDKRIKEEKDSKAKLETQVNDVTKLVDNLEENIKNLEKAILDKENYLKLAHTRLDSRSNRSNIELVSDPAQYKLIKEVEEIENDVRQLRDRLNDSHRKLKDLDRNKLILEKDIQTKTNTICIDEAEILNGIRKSLIIDQF